jgi:hypothetical protein
MAYTKPGIHVKMPWIAVKRQYVKKYEFFNNTGKKEINISPYSVQKSSKAHPACVVVFFTSFFHSCAYLTNGNMAATGYFRYPALLLLIILNLATYAQQKAIERITVQPTFHPRRNIRI